jgi:hypothetical protein
MTMECRVTDNPYDALFCRTNIHPNATLPIYRDRKTAEFVSGIQNWNWVGLYQAYPSNQNDSRFEWVDGVSGDERAPDWAVHPVDYTNDCVRGRPDGKLKTNDCGATDTYFLCEIASRSWISSF